MAFVKIEIDNQLIALFASQEILKQILLFKLALNRKDLIQILEDLRRLILLLNLLYVPHNRRPAGAPER